MIRWKYAIPRLILLAAVLVAVWLGLNPLVRWLLVSSGQSVTGAKVEVGTVDTSLLETELRLGDVRLADPRSPMQNLLQADEVTLALDRNALLQRKYVVREGRVRGLQIGTDRETSGTLEPGAGWHVDVPTRELAEFGAEWLRHVAGLLRDDLVDELESVRLAKELCERWPAEYERMEARANSLQARIETLRGLYESRSDDVLQNLEGLQQAAVEVEAVRRETSQLQSEVERLHRQVLLDRDAVDAARQRDCERIQQRVRLVRNLDPESLSEYLLGPELGRRVVDVAKWVSWSRQYLPSKADRPGPTRGRGIDVLFPGRRRYPDFLIESLALDGRGEFLDERFEFRGTATGLTAQPELYGRPAVVQLQVRGKTLMQVQAVLDHTGETPHEQITFNCPGLPQPERVLGRPGRLALAVSPGSTHLWVALDLKGDEVSGQIQIKQEPVQLVPEVGPEYGGQWLADGLQVATSRVRTIEVVVDLSGTLKRPDWTLRSNLGPQLAEGLNLALRRELELRRDQLLAYVRQRLEGELARLEQVVFSKQDAVLGTLQLGDREIQRLTQTVARRVRVPEGILDKALPEGILGGKLPANLPFRF